jgi:N-acetylglutamate synthase-like GNAT family acetyltransferase
MELALGVLALEQAEQARSFFLVQESATGQARELLQRLLAQIGDEQLREAFRCELRRTVPEWLAEDAMGAEE